MLGLQQHDHDHYVPDKWETTQQQNDQHHQKKHSKNQETPRLLSIHPSKGKEGTMITMVLQDVSPQHVKLAFNSLVVDTKQLEQQDKKMNTTTTTTTLIATIPNFETTFSNTHIVPVSVCYFDDNDAIVNTSLVANFTYQLDDTIPTTTAQNHQSLQNGRTRSYSYFANDSLSSTSNKRACQDQSSYIPSIISSYNSTPYSSYSQQIPANPNGSHSTSRQSIQDQRHQRSQSAYSSSSASSTTYLQGKPYHRRRASIQNLKSTTHQPSTPVANYQPYPGLINQSNFDLVTDLDTMMENWTVTEHIQGRRLVQFWRQDGPDHLIQCGCQPIAQNDPAATDTNNIVVSCIYWPEKDDYYITSVDAIYLLESLMKMHFGVEEKNRIRRNLEGFRPLTVAKCKPISAEFFKRVMCFPHPKPRNIEKDIKAFTWKILPYALKKIITKYAIASSTTHDHVLGLTLRSTSQQQQPYHSYQDNNTLTLSHSSIFSPSPSFGSSISSDSLAPSLSSSSQSPLPTPPSSKDIHHHQYQPTHMSDKQQLYYNPTTMTYGRHQEPGVRDAQSHDLEPCLQPMPAPSPPPLSSTTSPSPPLLLRSEPLVYNGMAAPFISTATVPPPPSCSDHQPISLPTTTFDNTDAVNSIPTLTLSSSIKYVPQQFMDENASLV